MKTFVLIVTFAATTDLIGGARTERIASFDDYQACAAAGRALYSQQHWECVRRRTSTLKTHQQAAKACAASPKWGEPPRQDRPRGFVEAKAGRSLRPSQPNREDAASGDDAAKR
jgi:hypothetical protein